MTTAPKYWSLTLLVTLFDQTKRYMSLAAVEDLTNAESIKEAPVAVLGLRNAV